MRKNSVFIILGILLGLNLLAWLAVGELAGSGGLAALLEGEPRPIGGEYGNKDIRWEVVIRVE